MTFVLFIQAIVIGLVLAMPIGPIALFCMRNSSAWGMRYGVITGIGAATADALYGLFALFGVMALSMWLKPYTQLLSTVGGIALLAVGLKMIIHPTVRSKIALVPLSLPVLFCVSFCLTLANPGTFLALCAIFSNFDVCAETLSWKSTFTLTAGIFIGSALWWLLLSAITAWSCRHLPVRVLLIAHRVMGGLFLLLGALSLAAAFSGIGFHPLAH